MPRKDITDAVWVTVGEAPEYEVSSHGEIRSVYTNRPLAGGIDKDGYRKLVMCTEGGRIHRRISSLVCEAFHGPRPSGCVVRHLDGSRTNDSVHNLAWGTQKQNIDDRERHGKTVRGERHHNAKLTRREVVLIRNAVGRQSDIAARFGISRGQVSAIKTRRNWSHVPDAA